MLLRVLDAQKCVPPYKLAPQPRWQLKGLYPGLPLR